MPGELPKHHQQTDSLIGKAYLITADAIQYQVTATVNRQQIVVATRICASTHSGPQVTRRRRVTAGVIPLIDSGELEGVGLYTVMEFIEGEPLSKVLQRVR